MTGRKDLLERAERAVDFALGLSTGFGWVPEVVGKPEGSETCAVADLVDCLLLLADRGHPDYYDVVDRMVRSHLVESQLRDTSWLPSGQAGSDDERSSTKGMPDRLVGVFPSWSAPNDFIGRDTWKLANCCTPAGIKALYRVWSGIVGGSWMTTRVNLLLNHASEFATVRSWLPAEGRVEVTVNMAKPIEIRVPSWVEKDTVAVEVDGTPTEVTWKDGLIALGEYGRSWLKVGQVVTVTFPVREVTTSEIKGGGTFAVTWRGNTVVGIEPAGTHHPLYQGRADAGEPTEEETTLVQSPGALDWSPIRD
jgi:DUF1680 family protein